MRYLGVWDFFERAIAPPIGSLKARSALRQELRSLFAPILSRVFLSVYIFFYIFLIVLALALSGSEFRQVKHLQDDCE